MAAAFPVGIAAASPGVNGAEIALWLLLTTLIWAAWPAIACEKK